MSYTVEDLDKAIEEYFPNRWSDAWKAFHSSIEYDTALIPGVGEAILVDQFGGEDQGSQYWIVVKITDADGGERFFRRDGYHQSHDGSYLDGPTEEVSATPKVVTVYQNVWT